MPLAPIEMFIQLRLIWAENQKSASYADPFLINVDPQEKGT